MRSSIAFALIGVLLVALSGCGDSLSEAEAAKRLKELGAELEYHKDDQNHVSRVEFPFDKPESHDLSLLVNLTNLNELVCGGPNVTDLTPLANLTNLNSLEIWASDASDLKPLSHLNYLQHLRLLYCNKVSDLTPIAQLTGLETLSLHHCEQTSDVATLAYLTNLKGLHLASTQVSDLSPLANLTRLQVLDLRDTKVSDVTPLKNLTSIRRIDLTESRVSKGHFDKLSLALPRCKMTWSFASPSVKDSNTIGKDIDFDRQAANWFLDYNGTTLQVSVSGKEITVENSTSLPTEPFHITSVRFSGIIADSALRHCVGLTHLTTLDLMMPAPQPLEELRLPNGELIPQTELLLPLDLPNPLGDEFNTGVGLKYLKGLKSLRAVRLAHFDGITNKELGHVKELRNLTNLDLSHCRRITDAGLAHVKGLTNLKTVNLQGCDRVTDEGVLSLQSALPKCKIIR